MGLIDKHDKSIFSKGQPHLTCTCPDTCCEENDPTPPSNCVWIFFWDLYDDGGVTPIQSGSNHAPNASPVINRDLGQLPLGQDYILRLTVEVVTTPVPAGITFNAFNSSGDVLSVDVDNAPITVPLAGSQILGEISIDSSAGVHQVGMKAESQCSDLEILFDYEIV